MIEKLYANKSKGHWDDLTFDQILVLLDQELNEFKDALTTYNYDEAFEEGCDVANFALMLATVALRGNTPDSHRVADGQPLKFVKWAANKNENFCIIWPYKSKTGPNQEYGSLSKGLSEYGRRAHRVACALRHGPPPTSHHEAAHSCGNSLCVNGSHLRWATKKENEADKKAHGTSQRGTKLTWKNIEEIRQSNDTPIKVLSKKFNVSTVTISKVLKNESWVIK